MIFVTPDLELFQNLEYSRFSFSKGKNENLEYSSRIFNLPESIKPDYDENFVCHHGNQYSPDDSHLIQLSSNLTVYTETSDRIFSIPTYGRPSLGDCNCVQQADTHQHLLWNIGSGKLIDYLFLHNHFHKMVSSGIAMNATFNSRKSALSDLGVKSSLSYENLVRACTGYAKMIQFRKEDFLCPTCGDSPSYIVCDGKSDGPTKRKVEHLQELDRADGDTTVLRQGSYFNDRVFLSENKERQLVCKLLTDTISQDDFLASNDIMTENGQMIRRLVELISVSWPDEIPPDYKTFLGNISKYSSVAGFLEVSSPQPLQLLEDFCDQTLNLRLAEHRNEQKIVTEELPALWPNLLRILFRERADYLPDDVSIIIIYFQILNHNIIMIAAPYKKYC